MISVVLAVRRGGDAARACLEALVPQVEAAGGELIVVVSGDVPADALPAIAHDSIRVDAGRDALVPEPLPEALHRPSV